MRSVYPKVSVVLLTYNQQSLITQALHGLFAQSLGPIEIVVSDDASTDGTWSEVQRVVRGYEGESTIVLNRNEHNLGIGANVQRALDLTNGDLIFLSAGDDISLPDRCRECVEFWLRHNPLPDLVVTDAYDMDFNGEVLGVKEMANLEQWSLSRWFREKPFQVGASHMLTRRLATLRPLSSELGAEDHVFVFRALLMNGAVRLPIPLVKHRRGGVSRKHRGMTYEEKRTKMLKGAANGLAEARQMLLDAEQLNRASEVCDELGKAVRLNDYVVQMLGTLSFAKRWTLFGQSLSIPFARRWRYFSFASFPVFFGAVMWLKASFSGNRSS